MIKNILTVVLSFALASSALAEDAPTTLLSAGTISPYEAKKNGLYMAADLCSFFRKSG